MVLRHEPERIGATLNANGWILIEDSLRLLKRVGWAQAVVRTSCRD